jgi:predicted ferric reductase
VTGLLTSTVALIAISLAARTHRFERAMGLDRALLWHRWLAESAAVLLLLHITSSVVAWSLRESLADAIVELTGEAEYMAMATVGAAGMLLITFLSLGFIRRRMNYETWYFIHLLIYAALALAFAHEIFLGADFALDPLARGFWIALHVTVLLMVVLSRWGKAIRAMLRPLTVLSVTPLNESVSTIELGGRNVGYLRAAAGQFALLRPMTRELVWQPHPFSISAAPRVDRIRFTVKALGPGSRMITQIPVGTKVALEGPYGTKIYEELRGDKLLLIAGGVGIAPVRSLMEDFGSDAEPVVIYRTRSESEIVHYEELVELASSRRGRIIPVVGRTGNLPMGNPFDPDVMRQIVPDVTERVAVVCGSQPMINAAFRCLRECGVDAQDIHFERIWW